MLATRSPSIVVPAKQGFGNFAVQPTCAHYLHPKFCRFERAKMRRCISGGGVPDKVVISLMASCLAPPLHCIVFVQYSKTTANSDTTPKPFFYGDNMGSNPIGGTNQFNLTVCYVHIYGENQRIAPFSATDKIMRFLCASILKLKFI